MFCVYILQSEKDNSYYVGHSDNLDRRIEEHNREKNKYTRNKTPWKLAYGEFFNSRSEAMRREMEIKKKKRKNYIEWLINLAG